MLKGVYKVSQRMQFLKKITNLLKGLQVKVSGSVLDHSFVARGKILTLYHQLGAAV